jgi:hypothetical protein
MGRLYMSEDHYLALNAWEKEEKFEI